MVKVPKTMKKYCPHCKKHTEHKVIIFKGKPRPKTKLGALKRGVRQYAKIEAGHGGSRRPKAKPTKTSKKLALKYECSVCKKSHFKRKTKRAKRVEQV